MTVRTQHQLTRARQGHVAARIGVRLDASQVAALALAAERLRCTPSEVVRRAIEDYLTKV